jgi:rhamnose transport system permease protein
MRWLLRHVRPEQLRELTLVLIIVAVAAFFATQIPDFLSARTFTRISTSVAVIAVVAVGQTLVVLTRNIDLSVGSIVGLVAYFGAGLGAVNGLLVAYGGVPAIVTTLGTLALYRVALVELSGAKTVTTDALPAWMLDLPRVTLVSLGAVDVRPLVVLAVVIAVVFQLGLRYLPFGRRLFAIGSNPDAARVAGFPVQRDIFAAFVLSGALAGLAGFMFLARFGNITVTAGQGLELQVVAAVVVGGVNIFGGVGSIIGALLGATLIDLLQQSLIRWLEVSEFLRDAILGLLILLAVASDKVIIGRLRTLWIRERRRSQDVVEPLGGVARGA